MISTKSTDRDTFPHPDVHCATANITPQENAKYDQNNGQYSLLETLKAKVKGDLRMKPQPKKLKAAFPGRAKQTAYSFFYTLEEDARRGNLQGPHVYAFSAKQTMAYLASEVWGMTVERCIASKLMPEPLQAYQMILDLFSAKGTELDEQAIWSWYQEYKTAYFQAKNHRHATKRLQGARDAVELHPLTTFKVGSRATQEELGGKNENMLSAFKDLKKVSSPWQPVDAESPLSAVDKGYLTSEPASFHAHYDDMTRNWLNFGLGRPPSPSPYKFAPNSPADPDGSEDENSSG